MDVTPILPDVPDGTSEQLLTTWLQHSFLNADGLTNLVWLYAMVTAGIVSIRGIDAPCWAVIYVFAMAIARIKNNVGLWTRHEDA
jgi:hypothetical protein